MKLSTRSRYSIRILLELARHDVGEPVQVSAISKGQGIPAKYLELLIRTLKSEQLVRSVRGAKGGHMLNQSPDKITMGQIVRLFEGQADLVACVSDPHQCDMAEECPVRDVWKEATQALFEKLDNVTIADLAGTIISEDRRRHCLIA
jgi:Rrf2 family iron-sulfur cluster assembly transcriptional regulator